MYNLSMSTIFNLITVVSFLIAMVLSVVVVAANGIYDSPWSCAFVDRVRGAAFMLSLSIALLLVISITSHVCCVAFEFAAQNHLL